MTNIETTYYIIIGLILFFLLFLFSLNYVILLKKYRKYREGKRNKEIIINNLKNIEKTIDNEECSIMDLMNFKRSISENMFIVECVYSKFIFDREEILEIAGDIDKKIDKVILNKYDK